MMAGSIALKAGVKNHSAASMEPNSPKSVMDFEANVK